MALTVYKDGKAVVTYGIDRFPDRKRYCLYRLIGNIIVPLAYFRNDADADEFLEFMHSLVPGEFKPMPGLLEKEG